MNRLKRRRNVEEMSLRKCLELQREWSEGKTRDALRVSIKTKYVKAWM